MTEKEAGGWFHAIGAVAICVGLGFESGIHVGLFAFGAWAVFIGLILCLVDLKTPKPPKHPCATCAGTGKVAELGTCPDCGGSGQGRPWEDSR